ncbi:MAG: Fic family protein [Bacilli bacterium]
MSEEELDSSNVNYEEIISSTNCMKRLQWGMPIGLQEVYNLKPSKYLEEQLKDNISGKLSIYEVESELKNYYVNKESKQINYNELECDFVSTRIVQLLELDNFELSVDYLKYVYNFLFQDVYEFAGEFRKINFSKHEAILNNDSVAYGEFKTLKESLEYDIEIEKSKKYRDMSIVDVTNSIADFSGRVWQVNPFRESNTRTTTLFIEKYLISLGYDLYNNLFKDKSVYFRNALVRSNYFNTYLGIKINQSYLIKFYENLLLGKMMKYI